jgi:hypothetical protein
MDRMTRDSLMQTYVSLDSSLLPKHMSQQKDIIIFLEDDPSSPYEQFAISTHKPPVGASVFDCGP